jgi:thioredoxin-dependent peroxiredoxin
MADPVVLRPGDPAPPFELSDQDGETVSLAGLAGRKVLVYFYPKASTPGCTTQACGLRDVADRIGDTAVVGVSPDLPPALRRFADRNGLGFTLASDPDRAVAAAYGAYGEKVLYGKRSMGVIRSAFLVDEAGRIEAAWYKISPKDTPTRLLDALGAA